MLFEQQGRLVLARLPKAEREKLMALQSRYRTLLSMLPHDEHDFDDEDADNFNAQLADIELIATEMQAITNTQMKILNALEEREE